jgi:hypothetical protein
MIELVSKSFADKIKPPAWITTHRREWSTDSSGSSLLSHNGSSHVRRGHRRQWSLSKLKTGRALCTAGAIVLLTILGLLWSFGPGTVGSVLDVSDPDAQEGDTTDPNGPIPWGKSVERGGREVFWWEQFPRYGIHGSCWISNPG